MVADYGGLIRWSLAALKSLDTLDTPIETGCAFQPSGFLKVNAYKREHIAVLLLMMIKQYMYTNVHAPRKN